MAKKIHLSSLGCPKNQVDAEVMLGTLVRDGYEVTLDPAEADVLIVNTCSFIEPAKEESIETILEMAQLKSEAGGRKLVVTGCLAERYGRELQKEMPEVDAFVGTGDFLRLTEVLHDIRARASGRPLTYVGAQHVLPDARVRRILTGEFFSAYLKVSEGCNHRCSFCIIPRIRGRHESRAVDDVLREAEELACRGVRELNLIAQDLTAYGRDLPLHSSLSELLRELDRIQGIDWIRLLYCYPNYVTDELLDVIATRPKICRYIDIPLQHGSDRILRAMRRERSADSLRRLVARVRARVPGVAIRTSFIVGFPGETDEDFETLCGFVSELEFDRLGVFRYSQEEDTEAGARHDQVSEPVKAERWNRLMSIQRGISRRKNQSRIGVVLSVLVCETREDGRWIGRTAEQAPDIDGGVVLEGEFEIGEMVAVRVTGAEDYDLTGRRAEPSVDEHSTGIDIANFPP